MDRECGSADGRNGSLVILLLLAVVAGLMAWAVVRRPGPGSEGSLHAELKKAESASGTAMDYDWTVRALDGSEMPMADLKGKVAFINLWATWCGPCRAEMPSIQRLYDRLKDKDVAFVLVSTESPESVRSFVEDAGYAMPIYTTARVPKVMDTGYVPATAIVAPDGKVKLRHAGSADWDDEAVVGFILRLKGQVRQ